MNNDQNKTIETLKGYLTDYVNTITAHDPKLRDKYQCPLCGSGTHGNGTGAFSITEDGKSWHCFSCNETGDIFDLVGKIENISDYKEQVKRVASLYNVTDVVFSSNEQLYQNNNKSAQIEQKEPLKENPKGIYKEYIEQCAKNINGTKYLENRGLPEEALKHFNVGYDIKDYCIVIPYGKDNSYYITRSVKEKMFRKPKGADNVREPVYNQEALHDINTPCFVCESPIDAMSIMYASNYKYNAVAVGGTGTKKLARYLKAHDLKPMLILNFDNDKAGSEAQAKAHAELEPLNIHFIKANYDYAIYKASNKPTKDANDLLQANLSQFKSDIEANAQLLLSKVKEAQNELIEAHNEFKASNLLNGFLDSIKKRKNAEYIPTGFKNLDKELDGGLYPGLYILGAMSSMGKTTMLLQLADQIAEQGKDVLYFSLEMGANELIAKSVSRLTYLLSNHRIDKAKTIRGILTPTRYANYNKEEKELIGKSILKYNEYAQNLYIYEGVGNIGIEDVKRLVKEHEELTNHAPVVFIDYLQILAPYDIKASDKQNCDKAVLELKRLSRDYDIPVIAISSFNRDSYTSEVNMSAFKESGAIEYGSDILVALQPQGMLAGYNKADQQANAQNVKECKSTTERKIEAVILKNRNGKTNGKVGFKYHAMFNCFEEDNNYIAITKSIEPLKTGDAENILNLIK